MTGKEIVHREKHTILRSFRRHAFEEMPFVDCFVKVFKQVDSVIDIRRTVQGKDIEIINKWCNWFDYKKVPYVMIENKKGMELWKEQVIFDFDSPEQHPPMAA